MHNIHTHCVVFELCIIEKKEERRKQGKKVRSKQRKKGKERRRTNSKLSCLVFSNLLKVSGTYRVNLNNVVCKLFTPLLCFSGSCSDTLRTGAHFKPAGYLYLRTTTVYFLIVIRTLKGSAHTHVY